MSGYGSSRDRDAYNPYKQAAGTFDHNAFIAQQQSYGNTHAAMAESKKARKNEKSKKSKLGKKVMTAQEAAEADAAIKVALRHQMEDEAKEAAKKLRRWKKVVRRNQMVNEGKVVGADAAFAEGLKGAVLGKENVEGGEEVEEWAEGLEGEVENAEYEGPGELVLENPDENRVARFRSWV